MPSYFGRPEVLLDVQTPFLTSKHLSVRPNKLLNGQSVLDVQREDHIPPLPIHRLGLEEWTKLNRLLPESINLMEQISFPRVFKWNDIDMVPIWYEKGAIYTVRIVPLHVFVASGRIKKLSLCNKPLNIKIDQDLYCGLEESCFFVGEGSIGDSC